MSNSKKILVIGGTGAMGVYLVPLLAEMGCLVDVPSLELPENSDPSIRYFKADCKNAETLDKLLANGYDAIYDFLIYPGNEFSGVYEKLLKSTEHYIYFSSYRVYAGEAPVTEDSPRLLDVSDDKEYLSVWPREYSLYKAIGENILHESSYRNYTIVRPSITYSKRRFQLVTLEADTLIARAKAGKTVLLPETAANVQGTLTWAGDTAKMLASIVCSTKAFGETYTLATAEHHTWKEIAEYYHDLIGLRYEFIPEEDYLDFFGSVRQYAGYQLRYDRLFDRVIDNTKILELAGLNQIDLMPLYDGLKKELSALPDDVFRTQSDTGRRMDAYLEKRS